MADSALDFVNRYPFPWFSLRKGTESSNWRTVRPTWPFSLRFALLKNSPMSTDQPFPNLPTAGRNRVKWQDGVAVSVFEAPAHCGSGADRGTFPHGRPNRPVQWKGLFMYGSAGLWNLLQPHQLPPEATSPPEYPQWLQLAPDEWYGNPPDALPTEGFCLGYVRQLMRLLTAEHWYGEHRPGEFHEMKNVRVIVWFMTMFWHWTNPPDVPEDVLSIPEDKTQILQILGEVAQWLNQALEGNAGTEAKFASDQDIWDGPKSPSEWRKQFDVSHSTYTRMIKSGKLRIDQITTKSIRIHRDDVARYSKE